MTSKKDGALEGMAGRPFRSHVGDSHPTTPLGDRNATTPLGHRHATTPLDDLEPHAPASNDTTRFDVDDTSRLDAAETARLDGMDAEPREQSPFPFDDVPPIDASPVGEGVSLTGPSTPQPTRAYDAEAFGAGAPAAAQAPVPPAAIPSGQAQAVQPIQPVQSVPPAAPIAPAQPPASPYAPAGAYAPGSPVAAGGPGGPPPAAPGPYAPVGPGPYPPQPMARPTSTTNEMGMWSLICAGVAVVGGSLPIVGMLAWLAPFVGVVLGIIGLTGQWAQRGKGLAVAGLVTNAALIIIVPLIAFFILSAFGLAFLPVVFLD